MVTIVVPVFNMESYLKRCVEALLAQTEQDLEILLVDDGSTDSCPAMCDDFGRRYPQIKVVHKKNGGLSSARNAGIERASGEFVVFPDPDDWTEPNYIECFVDLARKYSADLVCAGHYVDFTQSSRPANLDASLRVMNKLEALRALVTPPAMEGFAWNKLYRLDTVRRHGLRFTDATGETEDMAFVYQYLKYCETICFAPEQRTYHYCQREESATNTTFSQKQLQNINIYEVMIQEGLDPELVEAAKIRICDTSLNQLWRARNASIRDRSSEKLLRGRIRKYRNDFLRSSKVSLGRKAQCVCASLSPAIYCQLKNVFTKGSK